MKVVHKIMVLVGSHSSLPIMIITIPIALPILFVLLVLLILTLLINLLQLIGGVVVVALGVQMGLRIVPLEGVLPDNIRLHVMRGVVVRLLSLQGGHLPDSVLEVLLPDNSG